MADDRMTRDEWRRTEEREEYRHRLDEARRAREDAEARKVHEQTDLSDEELERVAAHHECVEQWSCSGCWHGRTCDVGRLVREVRRRRKESARTT